MTLIPQGRLWVRLGIEPEDLNLLSTGTPVVLTPVFNHRIKIHANLTQVHATVDPATHLMDAIVALKGRKAKQLAPGMPMHGVIEVRRATMLAVPRSAVLADGHGSYIFIVRNGHGHKIYVKTAFAAGQWIGIQGTGGSKLKPGARVVVTGNYELHDGMAVRTARS
jgi:multidrug efflux pump subunit AcrA (membrane-fusion protein)